MTDKEKLEAVKAELERLRHDWPKVISDGEKNHLWMYFRGLNRIRDFIDSLLKEPAKQPVDETMAEIEEKAKAFTESHKGESAEDILRQMQGKEPVSEDLPHIRHRDTLDEFSYQCAYDLSNDWAKETPEWNDIKTACKLGAQWQKKKALSIIKQYADKGEKNYQDSIGEMTYNYWDGFRDCANGIKRELED